MFEFRVYSPQTDETFLSGRALSRSQAWEKASFFILNDPRWKESPGVVSNVVDAYKNSEYLQYSTLDFGYFGPGSQPVALDLVEISSTN
ncbi:hypothetical protein AYJ05_11495 [Corynebacterium stationis]|uniref:Uncharacterized protein n=1 Tax=Corynebacterium stationis TaxID=1705 RepID=A0A177ILS2_9CORY|nr:hypothetical protein [Corynebacterium stationis]OAH29778.1 hypothetical protein AYJ05_11495 [Corynebacterium stationis]